jgi:hypothetical protein
MGSRSNCEELKVRNSSPHYPNDQTRFCRCEKFRSRAISGLSTTRYFADPSHAEPSTLHGRGTFQPVFFAVGMAMKRSLTVAMPPSFAR